jgi:hypothetical protein
MIRASIAGAIAIMRVIDLLPVWNSRGATAADDRAATGPEDTHDLSPSAS